jgi:chromosome segregation ATPase
MGVCSSGKRQGLRDQYEDAHLENEKLKKSIKQAEEECKQVAEARARTDDSSAEKLRALLEDQKNIQDSEYQQQCEELNREFERLQHEEVERRSSSSSRDVLGGRPGEQAATGRHLSERQYVQNLEAAAARRHHEEAEQAKKQLDELRKQLEPLQQQHRKAAEDLMEARGQMAAEEEGQKSSAAVASTLERRLAQSRGEHSRAEQRWNDLERHLKEQMKELRSELHLRGNELHVRDQHLRGRDKELAEVNGQLADLQSLFDDVNQQLQTECGRIEQLQETVVLCAKQGKELEALQGMLEESHRVLAQMRDALEYERAERVKATELLEHEQQRTQLLLDVLKHFKEKLQGLTPQMLLNRLGAGASGDLAKLLENGAIITNGAGSAGASKSSQPPSPQHEGARAASFGREAPPRSFSAGVQAAFAGSPRRQHTDGVASTIAADSSSIAPWAHSIGGSAAGMSAASGGRTPSPRHSRFAPSPSMVQQSVDMLPPRPRPDSATRAAYSHSSPRGPPAATLRPQAQSFSPRGPAAGPHAAWDGSGSFVAPAGAGPAYPLGQAPMYPVKSASWSYPGTAQFETVAGTGNGPYGYTGGSFGRM